MAALAANEKAVAGMAKDLRATEETEQFDLANYTEGQCDALMRAAFAEPFRLPQMIRFTFVIGGGKKVRQKYDDKLARFMTTPLREIGFVEDRTATATIDCAGTFKQQHDTDKDLKFLHVFPKMELTGPAAGGGGVADEEQQEASLLDLGSPAYLATVCSFSTFQKMVASKTQSWAQRRRMMTELKASLESFGQIEQKMIRGEALTAEEQEMYEVTSREDIEEKIKWLETQLKGMVDEGQLTMGEKQQLLDQVNQKINLAQKEIEAATTEGKPKKVEKLGVALGNMNARREKLEAIVPIRHALKHEEAIKELRKQIVPIEKLESKSGLRSMEEMKKIGAKADLLAEVERLQAESRGWFEEDADFEARCALVAAAATRAAEKAASSQAKKGSKSGGGKKPYKPSDSWETMSSQGSTQPKWGRR